MWGRKPHRRLGGVLALMLLAGGTAVAQPTRNQVAYWRQYYGQAPSKDPCVQKAHTIFERVVRAAGTPSERVPSLLITQKEPESGPLAITLPDGWIVLSKRVLDRLLGPCVQESAQGEGRLAFLLGHELAHHLQEDFWHLRLFAAHGETDARTLLYEVEKDRQSQELRADVHGILYAAMAGFSTHTVVADDPAVNFFQDWLQARADTHPTPQQRAEAVKARLRQVLTTIDLFHVGLLFYYAGNYEKAIPAFEAFRHVFDSREVYHNLATSHHQLALQVYWLWKKTLQVLHFHFSVAVDPETRARRIQLMRYVSRSADGPDTRIRTHLDNAITFYRAATARDAAYVPSSNNLGAALIIRSRLYDNPADLHAATATLLQVPADTRSTATLNNLGVAYWYLGEREKAHTAWRDGQRLAPAYAPVLFNLGEQAYQGHRVDVAQQYWQQYVQLEPFSFYTAQLLQRIPSLVPSSQPVSPVSDHDEHVSGVRVGDFEGDGIRGWGTPQQRQLSLNGELFKVLQYPHKVWTLSQGKSIHMILVQEGYTGASAGGIAIGDTADAVRRRYGAPSRIQEMPQGYSWCYDSRGIAFLLRQGQVISWLLYDT